MGIGKFFKDSFSDMKASAAAQHEVSKAELAAVKAESRATFEENRGHNSYARAKDMSKKSWEEAHMSPAERSAKMQQEREERIAEASARIDAANARYEAAKK
ncbi:MAG: hypothetical protein IJX38_06390 [Clostridia bacterium]|nr:hypothetical protein [Clostridia bacterium]